jgi:hypothetical protein
LGADDEGEAMCTMCVTLSRIEEKASGRVISGMGIIWRVLDFIAVGKAAESFEAEVEERTLVRTVGLLGRERSCWIMC